MGAVIAAPWVAEPFWQPGAGLWRHGYLGHATAAAAALANLDVMEREELPKRALELERDLASRLAPLADHPLVGEVRAGTGALAAVQFAGDALEADPVSRPWSPPAGRTGSRRGRWGSARSRSRPRSSSRGMSWTSSTTGYGSARRRLNDVWVRPEGSEPGTS